MAAAKPGSSSSSPTPTTSPAWQEPPRRPFLYNFVTLIVAGIVGLVPLVTGLVVFFDPLRSRDGGKKAKSGDWLRIASLDAVPPDGIPRQFPVVADMVDAWNRIPHQPIGSVYLCRAAGENKVTALNAICPHAGCFVAVVDNSEGKKQFGCPCHTSAFSIPDGASVYGPSPRGMDPLSVDEAKLAATGEIWVDFKNFYPGKHERKEKA